MHVRSFLVTGPAHSEAVDWKETGTKAAAVCGGLGQMP